MEQTSANDLEDDMGQPILPILRLQEAAKSSIPLDPAPKPGRPLVRLQRGPFRDRRDIWALAPLDDTVPLTQQKNLFGEAEDWFAAEIERCSADPRVVMIDADASFGPDLAGIIETLARRHVMAWISTSGSLSPAVLEALATHEEFVRVTVALATL